MPATTPLGIPYPLTSEPPNVAPDIQATASKVDQLLTAAVGRIHLATDYTRNSNWTLINGCASSYSRGVGVSGDRLTVVTPGYYRLTGQITWGNPPSTANRRGVMLRKNSNNDPAQGTQLMQLIYVTGTALVGAGAQGSTTQLFAANDYIQLFGYHDCAGAIAIAKETWSTFLEAQWVGPA